MILTDHLFNKKLPLLNRALDTYALRQQTIARNIANATSPVYRPESVRFEEEFNEAQLVQRGASTDDHHLPIGGRTEGEIEGSVEGAKVPRPEILFSGESHVNIDKEMSTLAQNQIKFRFASRMTARYFQGMQTAIKGSV
ncbi:MAG: flagellar basal body rod protein FlgB [Ignavibacteriae bacterium]|nr:flagellar basal body rod protein FlgB [Ignavibacteriota bacterium]